MSVTIADKLIEAAQNEQRIYKKGYDLGYEEGYSECEAECPKAVERSFIVRTNGNYKFTPADREVFSLVKLTVAVPSDVKEEEEGVFEVLENGEYDFLPSADKVFSKVKVTVDVPSGEIEGKVNVTDEFSRSIYSDATSGLLTYCHCPPTNEGGTTFTMMEFNSFGWVAFYASSGLIPGDVYDVYCVPVGELWQTVLFANKDYQTLAIPSSNANIRKYARYYENEGRLRITIPPDFSGILFINVKWLEGGCAIYKVEESEGGGTDDGSYDEGYNDGYNDGFEAGKAMGGASENLDEVISEQKTLIAQIKEALAGKAAGGGGEEYDPSTEYQRVEYITSAEEGTYPYIITDFYADNESGVEIIASFPILQDKIPMGSREDSGATRFYCVYPLSSHSIYYGFNTGSTVSCQMKVDTIYRCQTNFLNSRLVNVYDEDGLQKGSASLSTTLTPHTVPVSIFGYHSAASGAVSSKCEYKLYSARCSKNHEVVREYIPCYRKSDGVVGLYEKFTGQFLTAETGAFAKGADIDW